MTGKYKKLFPGIVAGSGFAIATPREELEYAEGDPRFQLYDFNFTDDIRLNRARRGLVSVNNGPGDRLNGAAGSESIGHQMYTGTGGQTAFGIGSSLAGGKSILVLPSSAMVKGQLVSRIVPSLAPGTVLSLPAHVRSLRGHRVRHRGAQGKIESRNAPVNSSPSRILTSAAR